MSIDVERPGCWRRVAPLVVLLLSASIAQSATTAASTTQFATLTLSDGRTTVTLFKPADFTESKASSPTQRVLETNDSSTRLTILPEDQPTDPASAAAFVENTKQSLTAARGADLLSAPATEQVENFALVMHYRVRRAPEQIVDTTVQWRRVGPVMVQAVSEVRSQSATTIDEVKNGVAEMLKRAYVEGYQEPTAKNATAAGVDANAAAGASVDAGPNVQRFAGDTVEFTVPPFFEQIGIAKSDTSRDYLSSDHNTELVVTLMPAGTTLDYASGPIQLAAAQRELNAPAASAIKPTTAPVLLKNTALPVEIQWAFDRDGKPATGFRMFRKIHPKQVVSCQITTTDASSKAQHLGETTLNSMKSLLPPDPPPVAKSHGAGGPNEEKRNQRAQAALDQAKKLADAKKDDEAYAKYKYIITEYPDSPSAAEAKTAMDKYEADPAFAERHKKPSEASPADKAASMLALADNYSYVGRQDEARAKYQQVIKEYPNTPAAEKAKKRLVDIGKR